MSDLLLWDVTPLGGSTNHCAFACGVRIPGLRDFRPLVKDLPEATVLCSSALVCGEAHLRAILIQTIESWARGIVLARNKSIDILLRLTAAAQISNALALSGISQTDSLAVLGICNSSAEAETRVRTVLDYCGEGSKLDNTLLQRTKAKEARLRSLHSLGALKADLPLFLQEKAALLNLSEA